MINLLIGYKYGGLMGKLDALHIASMILSGMKPVVTSNTTLGKIFSASYALYSSVAFITNSGFFVALVVHQFFHNLQFE